MRTLVLGSKLVALAWLAASALPTAVAAQDGWPWQTQEGSYRAPPRSANQAGRASPDAPGVRPPAATTPARGWREPVGGRGAPAYQDGPAFRPEASVERSELAPVMAGDGSGLPYELWRGLDAGAFEKLLAAIEIPPRSHALHGLWRRLMTAEPHPAGANPQEVMKFEALRLEARYRSGLPIDASSLAAYQGAQGAGDPAIAAIAARGALAEGRDDEACGQTQKFIRDIARLPRTLLREAVLISGYCVARSGDTAAAGVAAGFAREQGIEESAGLMALDAIAHGSKPSLKGSKPVSLIDYKLLAKAGFTDIGRVLPNASPALLVALSRDPQLSAEMRLAAGEAAARINAIDAETLAELYRAATLSHVQQTTTPIGAGAPGSQLSASAPLHRATLFIEAETDPTPLGKARAIRRYLDDARKAGLYLPALRTMRGPVSNLRPTPELSSFAETAIEVLLAADEPQAARAWLNPAGSHNPHFAGTLAHWRTLIDMADPASPRSQDSLRPLEALAARGGFSPDQLHRIATVLDALDYNVPIPLWELASRTPQPSSGHLPETGVLSRLLEAAKAKELGHTVLLAMTALGPDGPEGAHMIALGDAIRALRQTGLEAEARRLGFEALFAAWPRQLNG